MKKKQIILFSNFFFYIPSTTSRPNIKGNDLILEKGVFFLFFIFFLLKRPGSLNAG